MEEVWNHQTLLENLPEAQPSLQHSTNQAFMLVARQKPLLSKKAHDRLLGVCQKVLNKSSPISLVGSGLHINIAVLDESGIITN